MDPRALRDQLPSLVAAHVPRNCRNFRYRIYEDLPAESSLGFRLDPQPFRGKVIARTDEAIILKTGRIQFAAVDRSQLAQDLRDGATVELTPYARRDFQGRRIDTPNQETRQMADGTPYTVQTVVLGGNTTQLPLPKPRCPELAALIEQLQSLPAPDGFRSIAHLLVDANARDFTCVDPDPEDIIRTPPAIGCSVSTVKFTGQLAICYDRGLDCYAVELRRDGEVIATEGPIFFDDLGPALERLVDDGTWRRIAVRVLKPARRTH